MNAFDAIILIIFILFLARGIWAGLVGQLAFLAALILGFAAAGAFYGRLGHLLLPVVHNPQASFLITYVLLFLVTYLFIILLGKGLKLVMNVTLLGWFDRAMGGLFGMGKALFLSTLLFIILSGFNAGPRPFFSNAKSTPYLSTCSGYLLTLVKDNDLRQRFLPKQAAIATLLPGQNTALPLPPKPVPAGQPLKAKSKKKTK
ncbi:MAG: CvpA family protein [Desulfobulbaceae bacterium]|nr:CvpA family protein [Desulfobulbaceae bacterium]